MGPGLHTGQALPPVSAQRAEASAAQFAVGPALGAMRVEEDRWTHSRALDVHRPLYRVEVGGAQPGDLYVSSRTGEVVLDAPHVQQRWNYVGAWLHWLLPAHAVGRPGVDVGGDRAVRNVHGGGDQRHRGGSGGGVSVGTIVPVRRRRTWSRGCAGTI